MTAPEQELPPLPAILVRDEVLIRDRWAVICYALESSQRKFCFVTSCDVALNPSLISHLLSQISDCDVVVPHWQDRFQPCTRFTALCPALTQGQLELRRTCADFSVR